MAEPKFRRQLSDKQLYLLKLLFKFRFGTTSLLAGSDKKSATVSMNKRLKVLLDQEYISRRYDNLDRLHNLHAAYHLAPNAIRLLKQHEGLSHSALQNAYKDRSAGLAFIDHSLRLFAIYRHLRGLFGDSLRYYSRSELANYDYFPEKLPDAYLAIDGKEYFLDLIALDTPSFTIRKRLQSYIENFEDGSWPEDTYPQLLFICETAGQERRLQRLVSKTLIASYADEVQAYTTTLKALMSTVSKEGPVWTDVNNQDEPLNLWAEAFS